MEKLNGGVKEAGGGGLPSRPLSFPWMLDSDVVLTHCVGGKFGRSFPFFFFSSSLSYIFIRFIFYYHRHSPGRLVSFFSFISTFPSLPVVGPACYRTHTCDVTHTHLLLRDGRPLSMGCY